MKMENANVEFVTFEAQDVIATSFYALGSLLNGAIGTRGAKDWVGITGTKGSDVTVSSNLSYFKPTVYYSISPKYTIDGTNVKFEATEAPEVTATSHTAYLNAPTGDKVNALLSWLSEYGTNEQ